MAVIKAISYYLPEDVLDNNAINEQFPEWSADKISGKTGIYSRHIAKADEFVSDMAYAASVKLFEEHNIDKSTIDFILLCTQSPDYFLPTTACILQDRLGLPTRCGALDYNLGCSGFIYGLALAKGLIASSVAKNVLLITAEAYSKFIHEKDKSNRTIFGDAAAATLVSENGALGEIINFDLGTDGSGAENLIVKYGGVKYHNAEAADYEDDYGNVRNDANLYMNGSEIFNFTLQRVPEMVKNILDKNRLTLDNVDMVIPHQANKYMLNHLRKKLGIPENKFFYFLENCGNTVSATIPIALYEAVKSNRIRPGQNILLLGFGVGYSWGACLIKL